MKGIKKIWWWLMSSQLVKGLLAFAIIALLLVGTFAYAEKQNRLVKEKENISLTTENLDLNLQDKNSEEVEGDKTNDSETDGSTVDSNGESDTTQESQEKSADNNETSSAEKEQAASDSNGQVGSGSATSTEDASVNNAKDKAQEVKDSENNKATIETAPVEVTSKDNNTLAKDSIPETGHNQLFIIYSVILAGLLVTAHRQHNKLKNNL